MNRIDMIRINIGDYCITSKVDAWCQEHFAPSASARFFETIIEDPVYTSCYLDTIFEDGVWYRDPFTPVYYFKNESDATLFALRWL